MFTTFTRDDQMLSCELAHATVQTICPALATLVTSELGDASYRGPFITSWYGRAHLIEDQADTEVSVPFAIRCDENGRWTISVSPFCESDLAEAIGAIVPGIEFEVKRTPMPMQRAA